MIRIILFVIVALLLVVAGLVVALYHFFDWKGLIAFPFILIALVWLVKTLAARLFKRVALGLFGMKAGALRGATMIVHAVRSIPPETFSEVETGYGKNRESEPQDYFAMDVTIKPRIEVCNPIWEPSELILTSEKITSLADLQDKQVGTTHSVEVWNGTSFEPDAESKYPGEQRLKIMFAVKPGTARAWLHYYHEPIGELELPVGVIDV